MRVWRISNFADLSGQGGLIGEGRWHRLGTPIVYCADHPSTALLEILVHATRQTVPDFYQLIEIDVPDGIGLDEAHIRDDWESDLKFTQKLGTDFVTANRNAVLSVPSVIMPLARNYLLNPRHPDAARIVVANIYRYPFDSRLLK
jgi:RES domain-containing protein